VVTKADPAVEAALPTEPPTNSAVQDIPAESEKNQEEPPMEKPEKNQDTLDLEPQLLDSPEPDSSKELP